MLTKKRFQKLANVLKEQADSLSSYDSIEDGGLGEDELEIEPMEVDDPAELEFQVPDFDEEESEPKSTPDVEDPEKQLKNYLAGYVSYLRGIHLWFHAAHHLAKGPGFSGDHVDLYTRIYTEVQDEVDGAIEKAVGITGDENLACPIMITENAVEIIKDAGCKVDASGDEIAAAGLKLIKTYLAFLDDMFKSLEAIDKLSLGLNDQVAASANTHETYVYLLSQRVK